MGRTELGQNGMGFPFHARTENREIGMVPERRGRGGGVVDPLERKGTDGGGVFLSGPQRESEAEVRAAAMRGVGEGGAKMHDGELRGAGLKGEPGEVEMGVFLETAGGEREPELLRGRGPEAIAGGGVGRGRALLEQGAGELMPIIGIGRCACRGDGQVRLTTFCPARGEGIECLFVGLTRPEIANRHPERDQQGGDDEPRGRAAGEG